jgi:hypothetical protein
MESGSGVEEGKGGGDQKCSKPEITGDGGGIECGSAVWFDKTLDIGHNIIITTASAVF